MSTRTLHLPDELQQYLVRHTLAESELMRRLREETAGLPQAEMQISPEQGQFMRLLVELVGGRKAIEIGTFTGYSALCIASGLAPGGKLICCDVSAEWTRIAQHFWELAGLSGRIELRLGPALETLDALLDDSVDEPLSGTFDFAFIDADKRNVEAYYERCLRLLRPGGLLAVDNALRDGKVAVLRPEDPDTLAMHALNVKVCRDARVTASLVPIGDGLLLARKR